VPSDTPIVFVVNDDISVREALELLLASAGWQRRRLPPPANSSNDDASTFQVVSFWT
jgi:FixJ family two-component response regulator